MNSYLYGLNLPLVHFIETCRGLKVYFVFTTHSLCLFCSFGMLFTEKFSLGFSIWSVGDTGGQWNGRLRLF